LRAAADRHPDRVQVQFVGDRAAARRDQHVLGAELAAGTVEDCGRGDLDNRAAADLL